MSEPEKDAAKDAADKAAGSASSRPAPSAGITAGFGGTITSLGAGAAAPTPKPADPASGGGPAARRLHLGEGAAPATSAAEDGASEPDAQAQSGKPGQAGKPDLPVPVPPPPAHRAPMHFDAVTDAPAPGTRPAWSVRRPVLQGLFALVILVFGFGLWASLASISGAIVASGRVEVEQNRQVVQHPDGGVVKEILVVEGQSVAAGDVLIRLDGAQIRSEYAIVDGTLTEIRARKARLEAERDGATEVSYPEDLLAEAAARPEVAEQIDGQTRLFEARAETAAREAEQMGKRIEQIRSQIGGIDAQSAALTTQLALIREELSNQQALLDKGLAQASAVLALQREEARLLGLVGELTSQRAEAEERITENQVQIDRITVVRREEATTDLRDIGPQELELAEKRRALGEEIARLDIRAPVAGVVLGLTVTTPQAVVRPADPLLYIVPQDRPLVISAQVPPIHIDQVHLGQAVELVFSSFSSRTTPHLKGKVTVVSADAFSDQQTHASFYKIEIMLDEGEVTKLGDNVLVPGMPVEAFIQTEARSPAAYLLKPFMDYFNLAFRES